MTSDQISPCLYRGRPAPSLDADRSWGQRKDCGKGTPPLEPAPSMPGWNRPSPLRATGRICQCAAARKWGPGADASLWWGACRGESQVPGSLDVPAMLCSPPWAPGNLNTPFYRCPRRRRPSAGQGCPDAPPPRPASGRQDPLETLKPFLEKSLANDIEIRR